MQASISSCSPRPGAAALRAPSPPFPLCRVQQVAAGHGGGSSAGRLHLNPPQLGCIGSPGSTGLPLPGAALHRRNNHAVKRRQFNAGKCFERGRLGETSPSRSEEARGARYFTVPTVLGGSPLWFLNPGAASWLSSPTFKALCLHGLAEAHGGARAAAAGLPSPGLHTTRELWKTTLSSGWPRFQCS